MKTKWRNAQKAAEAWMMFLGHEPGEWKGDGRLLHTTCRRCKHYAFIEQGEISGQYVIFEKKCAGAPAPSDE